MLGTAIFGAAMLAAGCSSALPVDEYGDAVVALGRGYEEETTELQRTLETELQREIDLLRRRVDQADREEVARFAEEAVATTALRTRTFFAAVADALERYRSHLSDLAPPRAVADAHDELVAAMESMLSGLPGLLGGLEEAETFDAIDGAVNASVFADAGPRLRAACLALQAALGDQGVTVDLRCPA